MAAGSLLALLDDIASVLDDVATMSKVAAKKTGAVLGDDLALNAQQVSGIRAERELPVVWAVTKGSLKNKLILVPAALLISAFMPAAIKYLMMIGGAYLCFEGVEKLAHKFLHRHEDTDEQKQALHAALSSADTDMVAFEQEKIKGAIRTDFILSAEIIVISLGAITGAELLAQILILSLLALLFTFVVYGIVAAIVKLDDVGLWMVENAADPMAALKRGTGNFLLGLAPKMMKLLTIVGTLAMFLVGGGILVHNLGALEHLSHEAVHLAEGSGVALAGGLTGMGVNLIIGIIAGAVILGVVSLGAKLLPQKTSEKGT
ncbi:MAG TPA: DUF808 domain-containing protein [Oceanospirillales bacterium]|nr:hypothetical protein [Oceanospirillaceae bacterium]HBS41570.1 DUF808 domain-containing protein [Oceanospirillales bacterium]|tara:strand:- start:1377 stop:2330 length:954 start_codon:yes stop_codon:yes gene_type:complete